MLKLCGMEVYSQFLIGAGRRVPQGWTGERRLEFHPGPEAISQKAKKAPPGRGSAFLTAR